MVWKNHDEIIRTVWAFQKNLIIYPIFISIFSSYSRRQRVIIRNRAERVSELLDWKTLGGVSENIQNSLFLFILI